MELAAVGWGILVPGFVVGVGLLLSPKPGGQSGELSWGSLLLALGFASGAVGLFGVPPLPSGSRTLAATDWLTWMIALGGVLLFAEGKLRAGRLPLRFVYGAVTLGLLLRATIEYQWEGAEVIAWPAGLAALGLALWSSLNGLARRMEGASMPLLLLLLLTGLAVASALTGSAKIGQQVGLLCAGVGALWVVNLWRSRGRLSGAELSLIVTGLLGFGVCAHFYSELPGPEACLLVGAAFAPWLAEAPWFVSKSPRTRTILRLVLALLFVGAAVAAAVVSFEPDPYADYGY